jgi:hypothetical protein
MKAFILASFALLNGCALLPNTISPEIEHMSHATQHRPFTDEPTKWGAEIAQVTAEWTAGKHFYLDVSEGYNLNPRTPAGIPVYGEIIGPREQFTAKIGYKFTVRK